MKFCERCGEEIATKDGENRCEKCEGKTRNSRKSAANRRARERVLKDLGLVKVKGSLGGTYWE